MSVLTGRQRRVLTAVRDLTARDGRPPSLREVGVAVGLTSTSSVAHHVETLATLGHLDRGKAYSPRGLRLIRPDRDLALAWATERGEAL